jgi:hypothetical protein
MIRHLLIALLLTSRIAFAQDKPKGVDQFNEFNAKPLEGWVWDEDERLQDLVEQLQEKELFLQEIDAKIAKATGKKASSKMANKPAVFSLGIGAEDSSWHGWFSCQAIAGSLG